MPAFSNFLNKIDLSRLSKHFWISQNNANTNLSSLRRAVISLRIAVSACAVLVPFLNPNCLSIKKSVSSRKLIKRSENIFSKIWSFDLGTSRFGNRSEIRPWKTGVSSATILGMLKSFYLKAYLDDVFVYNVTIVASEYECLKKFEPMIKGCALRNTGSFYLNLCRNA